MEPENKSAAADPHSLSMSNSSLDALSVVERYQKAQRDLVLQSNDYALFSLAQLVSSGSIDVAPRFQRRDRWDSAKQSALIESFMLNLPIPPVYLAEESGRYSVIDGRQRLTAIGDFFENKLQLSGLQHLHDFNGSKFSTLPREISDSLGMRPLRTVTLLAQTQPDLKYLVFHRLNTAGVVLNQQEIRNVIFRGPLNDLLFELAGAPFLRQQLKITNDKSVAYRKMQDVEFVLRFLTLNTSWNRFGGDLARSMDDFMARHDRISKQDLGTMRITFVRALEACANLWGHKAYQRPEGSSWRAQTLAGLYDAEMVVASELSDANIATLVTKQKDVIATTRELFKNEIFDTAVRSGTNTPARIRTRITLLREKLIELTTEYQ